MVPWLANFFVNAPLAAAGGALIASPIIIHFINRMRFRRVRFAAMEFLLASQERNRRRLLIEQLILLLLRILIVLALVALIARLVLDPSQMALLGGERAHHVVLLDDSGSMRDAWGETTAFQEGLNIVERLVQDGATRPDTQEFTLILLSDPETPLFRQEKVNRDFVTTVKTKIEHLQCTRRPLDLVAGIDAARNLLEEEQAGNKFLHVISDFRQSNWIDQPAVAASIKEVDQAGIAVNLVKTVEERHKNLGVTALRGDVHVAAAGVPLRLTVRVKNFDPEQPAENVRLAISADDKKLPMSIVFDRIEAGVEESREKDIDSFPEPGPHSIKVTLDSDALAADNQRFLALDVRPVNRVLVIDGDPVADEAFFVSMALSAYEKSGIAPAIESVDFLGRNPLDKYACIFLLNVPQIPPDAIEPLKDYLSGGGGLAWFVGEAVNPAFYNDKLAVEDDDGDRLFPVPLGNSRSELVHDDFTLPGPDIKLARPYHAIFDKLVRGQVNPLIEAVAIYEYLPVHADWVRDDNERKDGVKTVASLRNGDPLIFEHRFGQGRVMTCLTSAGPIWNDWARNRSFPPIMLDLAKYVARRDGAPQERQVGEPMELLLDPAEYFPKVEIEAPGVAKMQFDAAPRKSGDAGAEADGETRSGEKDNKRLVATFRDTEAPGIYSVKVEHRIARAEQRLTAYNVPADESQLELASTADVRKRLGADVNVQIQEPGNLEWIEGREAGQEVREGLLLVLIIALMLEQFLAYVFSYHPKPAGATA